MRFYGYFRSAAAYRCRIAFNLKGLAPACVPVHLGKGEHRSATYLQRNPQGLLPALEVDGRVLSQSLAIIEWLEETYPSPPLLPTDRFDRAHVRSLALAVAADTHPLQNLRVLGHIKSALGQDQASVDRWSRHWIETGLTTFEAALVRSGTAGRFSFGDRPTLADLCLIPQLFAAERFGADIGGLVTIARIRSACDTLPAFADAHPSRQADYEA
jgi:maleylacetoacetate isomerase